MKCKQHPNREAVGQCDACGAGVCAACAEKTEGLQDREGTLCVPCYCDKFRDASAVLAKDSRKRLTRVIISIICWLLGAMFILFFVTDPHGNDAVVFLIVGILACGFYTGLTWRKAAEEEQRRKEMREGVTYVITESGEIKRETNWLAKIIYFIIGTLIGVVFTPIRIIIDIVGISKNKKAIRYFNQAIAEAQAE